VQAALLEAMEGRQVTVSGKTHKLPPLFMVMATQNPIEQEETYPLPGAQIDRFLMHVQISYPPVEDEVEVIRLVREEDRPKENPEESSEDSSSSRLSQDVIFDARKEIAAVHVSEEIDRYIRHCQKDIGRTQQTVILKIKMNYQKLPRITLRYMKSRPKRSVVKYYENTTH
jgi:MoxR-like ATPase